MSVKAFYLLLFVEAFLLVLLIKKFLLLLNMLLTKMVFWSSLRTIQEMLSTLNLLLVSPDLMDIKL